MKTIEPNKQGDKSPKYIYVIDCELDLTIGKFPATKEGWKLANELSLQYDGYTKLETY